MTEDETFAEKKKKKDCQKMQKVKKLWQQVIKDSDRHSECRIHVGNIR